MNRGPDVDAWYAGQDDPFGVGTRWYERRKRTVALAALTRERYARAWDAASGTGHLAADLLDRCDEVVASDAAARAVELSTAALARAGYRAQATRCALPGRPATAVGCDLVVLSEVLYYLEDATRGVLPAVVEAAVHGVPRAEVLAVTWRHHPGDAHLSGAAAQAELDTGLRAAGWRHRVGHREEDFVLDSWTRTASSPTAHDAPEET